VTAYPSRIGPGLQVRSWEQKPSLRAPGTESRGFLDDVTACEVMPVIAETGSAGRLKKSSAKWCKLTGEGFEGRPTIRIG
jgi:hypothetical protein